MSATIADGSTDVLTKNGMAGASGTVTQAGFAGWFKPAALTNQRIVFALDAASAGSVLVRINGTGGNYDVRAVATIAELGVTNTTKLQVGVWSFIAATLDFGVASLLYWGDEYNVPTSQTKGTDTRGTTQTPFVGNNCCCIGNRTVSPAAAGGEYGPAAFFAGVIPTQAQIQRIWQSFFAAKEMTGCVGTWVPGYGGAVTDYSGVGNTLTASGATLTMDPPPGFRFSRAGVLVPS